MMERLLRATTTTSTLGASPQTPTTTSTTSITSPSPHLATRVGGDPTTCLKGHLDSETIDVLLGKPDAVAMQEALTLAEDGDCQVITRVGALDDLEMLVENVDNANNLTHLQMYSKILDLLLPNIPDAVQRHALWVLGRAVENNPRAQAELVKYDPLPHILDILMPKEGEGGAPSAQTRAKAAYALTAVLMQNPLAVHRMDSMGGWERIKMLLQDKDQSIRRKIAFLIHVLLQPTYHPTVLDTTSSSTTEAGCLPESVMSTHVSGCIPTLPLSISRTSTSSPMVVAMKTSGLLHTLIEQLTKRSDASGVESGEMDFCQQAAKALMTYIEVGGEINEGERKMLRPHMDRPSSRSCWGLNSIAWKKLKNSVFV